MKYKTIVENESISRMVQEIAFKLGFKWYPKGDAEVEKTDALFLFLDYDDMLITYVGSHNSAYFMKNEATFISSDDIRDGMLPSDNMYLIGRICSVWDGDNEPPYDSRMYKRITGLSPGEHAFMTKYTYYKYARQIKSDELEASSDN